MTFNNQVICPKSYKSLIIMYVDHLLGTRYHLITFHTLIHLILNTTVKVGVISSILQMRKPRL